MATTAHIPVEVYLRSSEYEPDAEYVDGEIEERPMGEFGHADWQDAISAWFRSHAKEWNIRVLPELRVQVAPTRFRVPDVTVLDRAFVVERIVTHPPIAVFEVLSPEDTVVRMKRKLADYAQMGIPQIWVINPETAPASGSFERYEAGRLNPSNRFEQDAIQFDMAEIAQLLQG
jgi:Uma2 family endonuclease